MPIDSQHKEYSKNRKIWQLIKDCDDGPQAIKSRSSGGDGSVTLNGLPGTAYLPAPNATDTSSENKARYNAYLQRANFVNFTGTTKEGVLGLIFRKETMIEAPLRLEYLIKNANGGGLSTDQMIKDVVGDVLGIGRHGLLVDYPPAARGLTAQQVSDMALRANILSYPAESIINWRTETIGGITKLTMVVLCEPTEKMVDEFESKEVIYHRVLLLVGGMYIQNLYDDDGNLVTYDTGEMDENGDSIRTGDIIPRNAAGGTWDEIPFIFVGSINNDPSVDKAPLYDIAEINIAHYRNSADYEESSFLVGQPTPVLSGLTTSWVKEVYKDQGIALGSRSPIYLPDGGDAKLLQSDANSQPMEGMKHKEEQLIKIGARIITDTGGVETKDAAKMRYAGQNSKAGSVIINVQAAFTQCYAWAGVFMGETAESIININKEFYDATIDPQMIIAAIQMMDRGIWAKSDLQNLTRKGGLIESTRTNEDIDNEAENTSPIDGE